MISQRRFTRSSRFSYWTAAIAAAVLLATTAGPALADDPYRDRDASYLKVVDTFVYPVGVALEWIIFRPLHMFELRGVRGLRTGHTTRQGTLRIQRGCASSRPPRYCTDPRFNAPD